MIKKPLRSIHYPKREVSCNAPKSGLKGTTLHFALASLACALLCVFGGCSSSKIDPETGAKEIKAKDAASAADEPEAELLATAKEMYEVRMFSVARQSLESIRQGYPLGAYATFAEIKSADAYFFNGEYNEAAKAYEGFIKSYPSSPDLPYVELQAGRAHILSARGAGRDRQPLERGLSLLDSVVEKYPGTEFAITDCP